MGNIKNIPIQNQEQNPKILDQVHKFLRLHHYSIHTEGTTIDWIKRYIYFHRMKSGDDLADEERKIEMFLTILHSHMSNSKKGWKPLVPCGDCPPQLRGTISGPRAKWTPRAYTPCPLRRQSPSIEGESLVLPSGIQCRPTSLVRCIDAGTTDHSYRSATIGSSSVARLAGKIPKKSLLLPIQRRRS